MLHTWQGQALRAASPSDFWNNEKGAGVCDAREHNTAALCTVLLAQISHPSSLLLS